MRTLTKLALIGVLTTSASAHAVSNTQNITLTDLLSYEVNMQMNKATSEINLDVLTDVTYQTYAFELNTVPSEYKTKVIITDEPKKETE